jgi:hypothetical protein
MRQRKRYVLAVAVVLSAGSACLADDSARLLRVDDGRKSQIYVREVVQARIVLRGPAPDGVALFVHGAGTPAEVSFDVPYQDYSWMAYLAHGEYDKRVPPDRVRDLYADLGAERKVLVDLACSSHNAMLKLGY